MKKIFCMILSLILIIPTVFGAVSLHAFAANDTVTVNFSIYENVNGKYLLWKTKFPVNEGATALSILDDSGLHVTHTNGYVSEIDGFSELGHGANSGWIYKINGEQLNISAAKYVLKDGDKLTWIYVVENEEVPTTAVPSTTQQTTAEQTVQPNTDQTNQTVATNAVSSLQSSSVSTSQTTTSETNTNKTAPQQNSQKTGKVTTTKSVQQSEISSSISFLKKNPSNFTPLVLSLYNQAIPAKIKSDLTTEVTKNGTISPTDCERLIINLSALGYDVSNVSDVDLRTLLLDNTGVMSSGLNGAIFGLLATSHCTIAEDKTYTNSPDALVQKIIQNQNDDGGFSLTFGEKSDVDITAMALCSLSDYTTQASVASAVDKGVLWLLNSQNKDGSFTNSYGEISCESTAQVLIAMVSLEIEPNDERFVKNTDVYTALNGFFSNKAFAHTQNGADNSIATEQALLAFYAYNNLKNPYTVSITNHVDEINFVLYILIAVAVVILCAITLFILKRKGYLSAANKEKAAADVIEKAEFERSEKERLQKKQQKKSKKKGK